MNAQGECDFLVAGAGLAGISAAVQAGRLGLRTVLVEKEMMLGGNIGPNLGVSAGGALRCNAYWNETGIVEEIEERVAYRRGRTASGRIEYNVNPAWDVIVAEMLEEAGVTVLRKHLVRDVTVRSGRITAVKILNIENLREFEIRIRGFVLDSTGDAHVAAKAGAETRMGRESRAETGERSARAAADDVVSAASLTALTVDTGVPCRFVPPPGTPRWNPDKPAGPFDSARRVNILFQDDFGGDRAENHPLLSPQQLYLELRRRVYSMWDYIKNTLYPKEAETHQLIWISPVLGRRESRRIVGDYVLTQTDIESCRVFPDAIGFGGFFLDWHPPSPDGGYECRFFSSPLPYDIPFRCTYSRNVENLFAGGRTLSGTHVAFTSLRLARTNAAVAQATAIAAKLCIEKGVSPRELGRSHIGELQQEALKNDCFIIGVRNLDPLDLARGATVTASSEAALNREPQGDRWAKAGEGLGVALYCYPRVIEGIGFYVRNSAAEEREITLAVGCGETPPVGLVEVKDRAPDEPYRFRHPPRQNHVSDYEIVAEKLLVVAGRFEGWVKFDLTRPRELPAYRRDVAAQAALLAITGDVEVRLAEHPLDVLYATVCKASRWELLEGAPPCFCITPDPVPGRAENVLDGFPHREGTARPHQWTSRPGDGLPQWIELAFAEETTFNLVQLRFDVTERTWAEMYNSTGRRTATRCVADYKLDVASDGGWKTLVAEKDNYLRFRVHRLADAVKARKLRLTVTRVWGEGEVARVYEIRLYNEG